MVQPTGTAVLERTLPVLVSDASLALSCVETFLGNRYRLLSPRPRLGMDVVSDNACRVAVCVHGRGDPDLRRVRGPLSFALDEGPLLRIKLPSTRMF